MFIQLENKSLINFDYARRIAVAKRDSGYRLIVLFPGNCGDLGSQTENKDHIIILGELPTEEYAEKILRKIMDTNVPCKRFERDSCGNLFNLRDIASVAKITDNSRGTPHYYVQANIAVERLSPPAPDGVILSTSSIKECEADEALSYFTHRVKALEYDVLMGYHG